MSDVKKLMVLITHDSVDESGRIGSVLDNSGFKIIARHVSSRDELGEELSNSHIDIILAHQDYNSPSPLEILQDLNRLNRDVPVLIMTNELSGPDAAAGIRLGARDVVTIDEDQHLVAVVNRELKNREERSKHRDILRRFYASENRYQQLLQYARLPMAIIHESMFMLINDAFAELFELDKEDIDALPIVDILDKAGQKSYKEILKSFSRSPDSFPGSELKTTRTSEDGSSSEILIELNAVKFNDEDCIQLKIEPKTPAAGAENAQIGRTVARNKLIQHIESCISIAHSDKKDSSLLCIEMDGFKELSETLGISAFDGLYSTFTDYICDAFEDRIISVFDNNKIMVLLESTQGPEALKQATELCKEIDNRVFEFASNSQQITASIGISMISDLTTNADTAVKQSIRAGEQLLESQDEASGNGAYLYEPEKQDNETNVDIQFLLKQAFKHKHLQIMFQPMMKFHGGVSKNYEVLLGINPDHKDTYPDNFIALATRGNENDEIDRWVILEAMKTLMKKINCSGDERLYLHVSKQSIQNPKFTAWLGAAIKKSRLDPKKFCFQLREVDVSSNLNPSGAFVKTIKSYGSFAVVSNFGSSVQPMKILDQIPFDYAKIDGSFTLEAQKGNGENMGKILEQLGEKDVKSIVPMVESATILPILWKSNVAYIQGYYVQTPSNKMDYKF